MNQIGTYSSQTGQSMYLEDYFAQIGDFSPTHKFDNRVFSALIQSSFSHLGNSGNSAISVKGKALTNVKIFFER